MHKSIILLAGLAAALPARRQQDSYVSRMTHSFMDRGLPIGGFYGDWPTYEHATLYAGVERAIELTQDEEIYDWYINIFESHIVAENGTLIIDEWPPASPNLDDLRFGMDLLWLYEETGEEKYKIAADSVRSQFDTYPRLESGGFLHGVVFGPEMWLDGIFMGDSFYATWTATFDNDNTTAWDDIVLQFRTIDSITRNKTTGLLVHGFDETKEEPWADPVTGASPNVWSRAMGWYFIALTEVLDVIPKSHPGYELLLDYYVTTAAALQETQDPDSGGWWIVMNEPYPGVEGNYIESSASAMFTYGLLKGIREGYICASDYLDDAKWAYESLVENFITEQSNGTLTWEGTVLVGALKDTNATFEYYISEPVVLNDMRGGGAFLLAAYEMESWAQDY